MEIRPNDPQYPGKLRDTELENEIDHAAMVYLRTNRGNEIRLPQYGHIGKGPKNYSRSDELIKEDICDALYLDVNIDATDIEVEVKDGCVFLKGKVEEREDKWEAEDLVEYVPGVKDVVNEIKVKTRRPHLGRRIGRLWDRVSSHMRS